MKKLDSRLGCLAQSHQEASSAPGHIITYRIQSHPRMNFMEMQLQASRSFCYEGSDVQLSTLVRFREKSECSSLISIAIDFIGN